MAKFSNGINGPFSGKIGNVVGVISGNKNYGRSLPEKKDPSLRTVGQKGQSNKTKVLSSLLKPLKIFFETSFAEKGTAMNMHPASAVRSVNLRVAVKGTFPRQKIDWENVLVADGSLAAPKKAAAKALPTGFEITWDTSYEAGTGALPGDRIMIVLYSEDDPKRPLLEFSGAKRAELSGVITVRNTYRGNSYHVYLAFRSVKDNRVSKSVYCGKHLFEGTV